jgi:hypothetical protein
MALPLLAALCCAAPSAAAQEPCRLERAVAPDYGGVMLGMRLEELARMFPGSEELQKGPGAPPEKPFVASLGMLELGVRREEFRGAGELVLTFLEGRLHRIDVRYRQPVPWGGVTEFSEHASKRLAVPADSWGAPSADAEKQSRLLDCRGFSVVVRIDKGGPSTLSIVDTAAPRKGEAAGASAAQGPAEGGAKAAGRRKRGQGGASRRKAPARTSDGKEKTIEKEGR